MLVVDLKDIQASHSDMDVERMIKTRAGIYAKMENLTNADELARWKQRLDDNKKTLVNFGVDDSNFDYNKLEYVYSTWSALFWLTPDYSDIVDGRGLVGFDFSDISNDKTIHPMNGHVFYQDDNDRNMFPYGLPRGRVTPINGEVVIALGEACPEEIRKYLIEKIKAEFGLNDLSTICDEQGIKLTIREYFRPHWNPDPSPLSMDKYLLWQGRRGKYDNDMPQKEIKLIKG